MRTTLDDAVHQFAFDSGPARFAMEHADCRTDAESAGLYYKAAQQLTDAANDLLEFAELHRVYEAAVKLVGGPDVAARVMYEAGPAAGVRVMNELRRERGEGMGGPS